MDFLVDNAAPLAGIFFGLVVLGALALLGLRALLLWRAVKKAKATAQESLTALAAEGERLNAAMAAMPARQAELQHAAESLQVRIRVAALLGGQAAAAAKALRAPLKYLGG